jgi:hypothetical protein
MDLLIKKTAELGNHQKVVNEEVGYVFGTFEKELVNEGSDEKFLTLSREENGFYLLSSYRENHSLVKAFYKTRMINISNNRLMLENEKE